VTGDELLVGSSSLPYACYAGLMDNKTTVLERAFELARSGDYASVSEIKKQLRKEGYSVAQIIGRSLSKQLQALLRGAQLTR
jgi:hypothetical protein